MLWQSELVEQLNRTPHGGRNSVIASYAESTGFSAQHLYRIARENGYLSGRKPREGKGALKSVNEDQIKFIGALIHTSARSKKGAILPVEDALEIAVDNGIIGDGQISTGGMSRLLRERQINARGLGAGRDSHTRMRSLHPNHVHVLDASVCVQYYLRNGRTGLMDERDFYKNKPQNVDKIKTRLLRYVLVDHFSGAFFPYYFDTTGETQSNLFDFTMKAWGIKGNERNPFRGVPFVILMDRGSANTSKAIVNLFRNSFDIEIPEGMPYNPRKQGAAEVTHNIWERHFESRLVFKPAWGVEELNAWASDYAVYFNAKKIHTRHGMTRTNCWMQIQKEQLRELPAADVIRDLFQEPEKECTCDGTYTISFRGTEYRLAHIDGLFRGSKVKAILKPLKWPIIDVIYREQRYEASPLPDRLPMAEGVFRQSDAVIGREYRSSPETASMQAKTEFDNMAYGEAGKKPGAIPFEGLTVFGIHAEKVGNIAFMPKAGVPIEVDRSVTEKLVSFTEFLKRLIHAIGPISPALNQSLRAQYGESIDIKIVEEVIENLKKDSGQAGMTKECVAL